MTGRNPLDRAGPSIAGVYNYLLGGRDNYAADRELAAELTGTCKIAADFAAENRAFLTRAVTWAAEAAIGQYLDLGAGFPVSPVTHEPAGAVVPAARVAYVDADPVVAAHAAALLTGPGITAYRSDLRDADGILARCEADGWDLAEPACVLLGAVLHFLPAREARDTVAGYVSRLAPGSAVVISVWGTGDPELSAAIIAAYTPARLRNHPRREVARWFAGLEMVPPGLAEARAWRPGWGAHRLPRRQAHVLTGVARKP